MQVYLISDFHFFHYNIIKLCGRKPHDSFSLFSDEVEMNDYIIQRHNDIVKPNDTVWNFGDFALCPYFSQLESAFKRLNGNIHLITGNHDHYNKETRKRLDRLNFKSISDFPILFDNRFLFSHKPCINPKYPNIHGHLHEKQDPSQLHLNVSVEKLDYKPMSLDQAIQTFKTRNVL